MQQALTTPLPRTPFQPAPPALEAADEGAEVEAPPTSSGEVARLVEAAPVDALTRRPRGPTRTLPHRFARYTLFDHIGRGGMADIYLASARTGLGGSRRVVIKEVLPDLAGDRRFCEMLIAEAKLAARLNHANVVKVEDLGRDEGVLYIAMEYVEGFDLRDLLRRCAKNRVPLPIEFSLLVVSEALRALDYAHRFRAEDGSPLCIVHRDVSPSNVLISFEGEVKLCDFGIARANDVTELLPEETIQGKAGYMSPEHASGEAIDARADVFAAGIILWELLSGRRLYRAQSGETLLDVARRAEVPPLPERGLPLESDLHAIVMRALSKDRHDRYLAAAGMLRDLEEYAAAAQMVASPLRFGDWLMEHFGEEIVAGRRGRERALRAIERGPIVEMSPVGIAPAPAPATAAEAAKREASEPRLDTTPPRGIVLPGPIAITTKSTAPPRSAAADITPSPTEAVETAARTGTASEDEDVELDELSCDGALPTAPASGAPWAYLVAAAAAAAIAGLGWLLAHVAG